MGMGAVIFPSGGRQPAQGSLFSSGGAGSEAQGAQHTRVSSQQVERGLEVTAWKSRGRGVLGRARSRPPVVARSSAPELWS